MAQLSADSKCSRPFAGAAFSLVPPSLFKRRRIDRRLAEHFRDGRKFPPMGGASEPDTYLRNKF